MIGSSFSGIRALSKYVTQSIELFFALLLFLLGVVTLSHSEKVVSKWEAFTGFLKNRVADPFLYSMGERKTPEPEPEQLPDDDEESATGKSSSAAESKKPLTMPRQSDDSMHDVELKEAPISSGEVVLESPHPVSQSPTATSSSSAVPHAQLKITWFRLFILVFVTVFVLELPDKTMLMIATLAQTSDFPLAIFCGYAGAMVTQSLIALIVGKGIGTAAAKYGEWIEFIVGIILTLTGAAKIAIMVFVGEFSIDDWTRHASSSTSASFH